jgi:hypothetical protein
VTVEQRFADVRERSDRPVGHGKADAPRPSITCLQSQIGGRRHLRSWGSGAGRGRRGVVRGCPLGTDHDRCEWHGTGTARGQPWYACRCWVHLGQRVRAVRGNHGCSMPAELGSSRPESRGGSTCRFSRRPRLGTLSRHLYCGHFDARRGKESASLHSMDTAGRCHIQLLPIRT